MSRRSVQFFDHTGFVELNSNDVDGGRQRRLNPVVRAIQERLVRLRATSRWH
jgi:hypothetical protein